MSYIPQSGIWDTVKQIGGSALDILKQQGAAEGASEAYKQQLAMQQAAMMQKQQGGLPSWALPVGLGVGALVLFMVLKKK